MFQLSTFSKHHIHNSFPMSYNCQLQISNLNCHILFTKNIIINMKESTIIKTIRNQKRQVNLLSIVSSCCHEKCLISEKVVLVYYYWESPPAQLDDQNQKPHALHVRMYMQMEVEETKENMFQLEHCYWMMGVAWLLLLIHHL